MPNFIGTESWDYFSEPLKNRVEPLDISKAPLEIETIIQKNIEASPTPFATALSGPARFENDGTALLKSNVGAPYEL